MAFSDTGFKITRLNTFKEIKARQRIFVKNRKILSYGFAKN